MPDGSSIAAADPRGCRAPDVTLASSRWPVGPAFTTHELVEHLLGSLVQLAGMAGSSLTT